MKAFFDELMNLYRATPRPTMAIGFGGAFIFFTYLGKIPIEVFTPVAVGIIQFYFVDRVHSKKNGQEGNNGEPKPKIFELVENRPDPLKENT